MMRARFRTAALIPVLVTSLLSLVIVRAAATQGPQPATARLILTVVDPTGGVMPAATVTIKGLEPATSAKAIPVATTSPQGVVTLPDLAPGRYSIQAEFPGFETRTMPDVRLRSGDNRQTLVLALPRLQDSVNVSVNPQVAAADRAQTFGTALTREQLAALSDDPAELRRQLQEMAGFDAVIRVDSFEGAELPPKAQIKAIHITRDAFAAENHSSGGLFVDIITQPGVGPLRGGMNARLRDGSLNAKSPFSPTKGPEQTQNYNFNVGGTIKPEVSSFSLSVGGTRGYETPIFRAALPQGTLSRTLGLRQPSDGINASGLLDYSLTRDQTLRIGVNGQRFTNRNQGMGAYDLPERAFSSTNTGVNVRVQEAGPLGRRFFINTRASVGWFNTSNVSAVQEPTIIVTDAFTSGGQQRAGSRRSLSMNLASDLDYIKGIHSVRTGILLQPEWYRSNDAQNYLGTYTFESLDAYDAGTPRSYTRRIGDPNLSYFYMQGGGYVQDDIRVRRNLTLSPGLRIEGVTHVSQRIGLAPRFGITWAPFKSGRTTLRASSGIFYDWLPSNGYEQSLRIDGFHQQELNIVDPVYDPDNLNPGSGGVVPPGNRYILGDDLHYATFRRLSAGIDQTLSPRLRVSMTYAYLNATNRWRGENINAPVDGVRPNPQFANVVVSVSDGNSLAHTMSTNFSLNLAPQAAPAGPGRPPAPAKRLDWRRLSVNGTYSYARNVTNAEATAAGEGIFSTPATGDIALEWGPTAGDVRHRLNMGINSTALRNLNVNLNLNLASAGPYNVKTGFDDNGDLIFNDRPAGVGRNSGRGAGQRTLNANIQYTIALSGRTIALPPGISINGAPGGAPPTVTVTNNNQGSRYRIIIAASIQNITNHYNYGSFSGTMTSPFFAQPQSVINPRKVDFQFGVTF